MLQNRGSLATGKAGAGSAVMADGLGSERLVEGRESGEDVSRARSRPKVIADALIVLEAISSPLQHFLGICHHRTAQRSVMRKT